MTTDTNDHIGLHFGALCDSIETQLKAQGITINCEGFQHIADAITTLHIHQIIPDSTTYKAHQKLMKKICEAVHKEYDLVDGKLVRK